MPPVKFNSANTELPERLPSPHGRGAGGEGFESLLSFARRMRSLPTGGEELMWHILRRKQFMGLKFFRQKPFPPFILDFYCHELKLAVEIDGPEHFTKEGRLQDVRRDRFLKNQGIRVYHIEHDRLLVNPHLVLAELRQFIEAMRKTDPLPRPLSPKPPHGQVRRDPGGRGRSYVAT